MITEIFAVLDAVAERYIEPFTAPTIGYALREFEQACSAEGSQFQKFPEDFSLWHVGTFDMVLGEIAPMTAHKIGMATSFVSSREFDGPHSVDELNNSVSEREA